LFSCNTNSELKEIQLLFVPSFDPITQFTIDIEASTIKQYTYRDKYRVEEPIDSISYNIIIKDTLIVYHQKTYVVDGQVMKKFLNEIKESRLDSTIQNQEPILDGIGYRISKINFRNDTISLTSNISNREEAELEYKLLDPFFELTYSTIQDYDPVAVIENIQDHFSYGLPIRKVNDNPIEYRIWGGISGCREDNQEFLEMLEALPIETPIIFDLRNGSIAMCLNEVLEEFSLKKSLYFYGDRHALESKEIIDEIEFAEDNGEVLNELRLQALEFHKMVYDNWQNNKTIKSFNSKKEVLETIANNAYKK
jgi:hypothetical protein